MTDEDIELLVANVRAEERERINDESLRDWFAGMVLQGFFASYHDIVRAIANDPEHNGKSTGKILAEQAYTQADAMLTDREKNQ